MHKYFNRLSDFIAQQIPADEIFTACYSGESSDFVRFNHAKYRQSGHVEQHVLDVDLICDGRSTSSKMTLSCDWDKDCGNICRAIVTMREQIVDLPKDPFLLYATDIHDSVDIKENLLLPPQQVTDDILRIASGLDLVGIYAAGSLYRGFSNSFGQRNFFASHPLNLDVSIYHHADKAIKVQIAGFTWNTEEFSRKIIEVRGQLDVLARPSKTLQPGKYNVFFAPAAVYEMLTMLNWGGLSEKAMRTKQSPLLQMRDQNKRLNSKITLIENSSEGVGPLFQTQGFSKPKQVALISEGALRNCLISPRTAQEFDIVANGASDADGFRAAESMHAMDMLAGDLAKSDVLQELGTGVLINNLWYLNFSDRAAGKITGMTRFATFWVEDGKIITPLNVMRFDDSIFRIFGDNLLRLTKERSFFIDNGTYEERSTQSAHLPGMLVKDFNFTL